MDEDTARDHPPGPQSPSPKSTNNDASSLSTTMKRMSLGTAASTQLPPSSPVANMLERSTYDNGPFSPKLRRTASSTSVASISRSGTPTLTKKSSLSSLKASGTSTPPRSPSLRRSSSNLALACHPGMPGKSLDSAAEEPAPAPVTAGSVAHDFLERDINSHASARLEQDLTVIIHDACYGHRYSRPRTSKASLSTIVERPERILATVMGISSAYVRLGGRYAGSNNAPHPEHTPGSVPFKIQKSNRYVPLTSPPVTAVHGTKWMNELKIMCEGAESKLAMGGKELSRPLQTGDDNADKPKLHEGDLYLCSESLNALEGALGGVFDAVDAVFDPAAPNRAFVAIRPPGHHCSDDYPSGFCWINNVHVGISHASAVHGLTHAVIIDFDLHHGDGSQSITWAHNAKVASLPKNAPNSKRTAIGYFSLHDINSYPCEWGDEEKVKNASLCVENAHGQTIWNVHLQPWKTDADFWRLYETRYLVLLDKTRTFLQNQRDRWQTSAHGIRPRAAIFISAGFDASEWEGQGMQRHKVNVPTDFYARFTRDINELAVEEGLGVDGRVISVLEGGYSDRALTSGVLSHISGMATRDTVPDGTAQTSNGLGHEMSQRLGDIELEGDVQLNGEVPTSGAFDSTWWSPSNLEELEGTVYPPPPPPLAPKKPRGPVNPTYTTPTQSFAAKVVPTARRSLSGSTALTSPRVTHVMQPPPEVGWATAVHELAKILTPDRQTRSCKPEDLNAKATEARRNRQSAIGVTQPQAPPAVEDGNRMQLRGRKAKAPSVEPEPRRLSSRSSRRQTFGGTGGDSDENNGLQQKAPKRRVSIASTILSTAEEVPEEAENKAIPEVRRPSSSLIRPGSSASTRPTIAVEKTRARPRSPPKPRLPKKAVGRPPGTSARNTSGAEMASKPASKLAGIDSLTSGVKKMSIKLNVPPKKEQEAREAKVKAVKAPRKPSAGAWVAKKDIAPAPPSSSLPTLIESEPQPVNTDKTQTSMVTPASTVANSYIPQASIEPPSQPVVATTLNEKHLNELQPSLDPAKQNYGKENMSNGHNLPPSFLPPGPETILAPTVEPTLQQVPVEPSVFSPVTLQSNAAQPTVPGNHNSEAQYVAPAPQASIIAPAPSTPIRQRQDLPIFTSTSPIHFGPPKNAAASMSQVLATEASTHPTEEGNVENTTSYTNPSHTQDLHANTKDIWDVPEAPQQ